MINQEHRFEDVLQKVFLKKFTLSTEKTPVLECLLIKFHAWPDGLCTWWSYSKFASFLTTICMLYLWLVLDTLSIFSRKLLTCTISKKIFKICNSPQNYHVLLATCEKEFLENIFQYHYCFLPEKKFFYLCLNLINIENYSKLFQSFISILGRR